MDGKENFPITAWSILISTNKIALILEDNGVYLIPNCLTKDAIRKEVHKMEAVLIGIVIGLLLAKK